jgi:hypothetical protein
MPENLNHLIDKKLLQLQAILDLLEEPCHDYEGFYKSLLQIEGVEGICPEILSSLKREVHGGDSIQELVEKSQVKWYWSASIGRYLNHESGETLEKSTGVVLPPYGGTIETWNRALGGVIAGMIKERLAPHSTSEAIVYAHPRTMSIARNLEYNVSMTNIVEKDTVVVSIDGKSGIVQIKNIV